MSKVRTSLLGMFFLTALAVCFLFASIPAANATTIEDAIGNSAESDLNGFDELIDLANVDDESTDSEGGNGGGEPTDPEGGSGDGEPTDPEGGNGGEPTDP